DQDPLDLALIATARERHVDGGFSVVRFAPFSPETRRTEATVVDSGGRRLRVVKGALATIADVSGVSAAEVEARSAAGAARGYRSLAVAMGNEGEKPTLAGIVQFSDPPRPDSGRLIAALHDLGVKVTMLTGDGLPVARGVARDIGLGEPVPAARLREALEKSREAGAALAREVEGFAEVFPEDKYRVVEALQADGHVVGMTGDGVNDAPALRQAEVGIAVSGATDAARGAASVVLTSDGLAGIAELVVQGRIVYQRVLTWIVNKVSRTIQKSALVVVAFLATGRFVVSTSGMLLLLFMTDFVKISLATDRMQGSQHPDTWNIGAWVRIALCIGVLMLLESLALLAIGWRLFDLGSDLSRLQTFTFQMLLFFALFSIVSVRERRSFWASAPSRTLTLALAVDAIIGAVLPFADLPGLRSIPWVQSLTALGGALIGALLVNDPVKVALIRRVGVSATASTTSATIR
ncbi:MAG TPA: HAD-IC family P-type ATPase, partial [Candidatus Methylomirabilis sp.]|nr:HAD-IC family P-type ATPase [Candidatus Methylomirabilis sp.]